MARRILMCKIKRHRLAKKAIHEEYCHLGDRKRECPFTETCSNVNGRAALYEHYKKCNAGDFEKGFNAGWNALIDHIKKLPWNKALDELGIIIEQRNEEK